LLVNVLKGGVFTTNERDRLLVMRSADNFARHSERGESAGLGPEMLTWSRSNDID